MPGYGPGLGASPQTPGIFSGQRWTGGADGAARAVHGHDRQSPTEPSTHRDFRLGAPAPAIEGGSLYCLDVPGDAALRCDVPYARLAGIADFAYAVQGREATRIARLPVTDIAGGAVSPELLPVFSIGRCGSTLLLRILGAAGCPGLDELDGFTHLGPLARQAPRDPAHRAVVARLARALLADVSSALPDAVLKMRSHASAAAGAIMEAGPRRAVVLVRDMDGWAASMARAFPDQPPDEIADALAAALVGLAQIPEGRRVFVTYDDLHRDPVGTVARIAGPARGGGRSGAIRAVLTRDSQAGTSLSRGALRGVGDGDAIRAAWRGRAPAEALASLGLGADLRPFDKE